tara:strand:+ start:395 stop:688 length:294 start_codon:yes stop_codon:yes gene_type:complete
MEIDITSVSIGSLIAVAGGIISYAGYTNKKNNEKQERIKEIATLSERVASLDREIDEVKEDVKSQHNEIKKCIDKLYLKIDKLNDVIMKLVSNLPKE